MYNLVKKKNHEYWLKKKLTEKMQDKKLDNLFSFRSPNPVISQNSFI